MADADKVEDIVVVPVPSRETLNQRQLVDYRHHRTDLIRWIVHLGKNLEKGEGYAYDVAKRRAHDLDKFYWYVWREHANGYTTAIQPLTPIRTRKISGPVDTGREDKPDSIDQWRTRPSVEEGRWRDQVSTCTGGVPT